MSNLFVNDDDDDDVQQRYQPTTTSIKEETEEEPEIVIKKEYGNDIQLEYQQFEDNAEEDEGEDDHDPIIDSIPLVMNTVSSKQRHSLHILQYPGRPKNRPLNNGAYSGSIKLESQYLEMTVPAEQQFFNKNKIDKWGEDITEQKLSGVLDKLESGAFAGKLINDGNERKVVLIPIDSSAQLRTSFKYIDNSDNANHQMLKKEYAKPESEVKNVTILQSAAKNSTQNQDGFAHTLGDSLKSIKKFDEEKWKYLNWRNNKNDPIITNLKNELENGSNHIELSTNTQFEDYIDKLINN
ncbi:unnamed protein product [Candida verbasci]|uniref:Rpc37p n=1 Tax=Candida verbasci TaxID=1227364 RepID=A0A9W4TZS4_9ASCO|nr:unnamed protein product [Candida verbasci]